MHSLNSRRVAVALVVFAVIGLSGALTAQTPAVTPVKLQTDFRTTPGTSSNINGVLEPGETVQVAPFWTNASTTPTAFTGTASGLTGPAGGTYTIDHATANYGTAGAGATVDCNSATGDCYLMTVGGARTVAHWDATFTENLTFSSAFNTWTIHIGDSFTDVLTSNQFYFFVESLFHSGVTGGCGVGIYCPNAPVNRAQMAAFLLKAEHGANYVPPLCSDNPITFDDVTCPSLFADWIEQLAAEGITAGCATDLYCPSNPVTRAQMSVFLLKTEHGSAYVPPACTQIFNDVPCPSLFAAWIQQLYVEQITGGCGGGNYCPDNSSTRGQMAVFLDKIMGLPGPPPATVTFTPTVTLTPTTAPTFTFTFTPSITLTPTVTRTGSNPPTSTRTPTQTFTPTITPSITITPTRTNTNSPTFTRTGSGTNTATRTRTPTATPTPNPFHVVAVGPGISFVDSISGTSLTTITAGETVSWVWQGATHSTTSGACTPNCIPDSMWNSGQKSNGFFNFQFPNVGTYSYYCTVHGVMMTGIINVLPVPPPTFTPTP